MPWGGEARGAKSNPVETTAIAYSLVARARAAVCLRAQSLPSVGLLPSSSQSHTSGCARSSSHHPAARAVPACNAHPSPLTHQTTFAPARIRPCGRRCAPACELYVPRLALGSLEFPRSVAPVLGEGLPPPRESSNDSPQSSPARSSERFAESPRLPSARRAARPHRCSHPLAPPPERFATVYPPGCSLPACAIAALPSNNPDYLPALRPLKPPRAQRLPQYRGVPCCSRDPSGLRLSSTPDWHSTCRYCGIASPSGRAPNSTSRT